jgi:hypothetical protein
MKRLILCIVFAMLLPSVSEAASAWGKCGALTVATATSVGADRIIGAGQSECFYFNGTEDSDLFFIVTDSALIQLAPDVGAAGGGAAAVMIQRCQAGVTAYDSDRCLDILDVPLDGTAGSPSTQNAAVLVGRGTYAIRNSVDAATDEAIVSVEGQ